MPDHYIMLLTLGGIIVASLIGLGLYAWWCEAEETKEKKTLEELKELSEAIGELKCDMLYRKAEIIKMIDETERLCTRITAAQRESEDIKNEIDKLEKIICNKVEDDCK